ncbi:hypothetical protein DH2020_035380 [Rehmannia glutinosa]|uniref:DUF4283 domain-containing protein n=1 Tax=Rehmannia glutinosa TaxID=99300 RepID=A0ABR0V6M5_REHGL
MADSIPCPPENQNLKFGSYANVTASCSNRSNLPFDPKRVVPVGTHKERDGKQILGFSSPENDRLAAAWKLTLIGKFSFAIPHPKGIASGLSALNLKGTFSWSFANPSHIIIKLQLEEDFNKLWMGTLWSLGDCPMRVFKWTPSFNPRLEAPLAPVWIRLPGLPIHFFDHNALFAISKILGTPLQVDSLTATRSRLSMARVCVELDLLKERIEEIILEFDDTTHAQKIIYERVPDYCTFCKHIGHSFEGCYRNGNKIRPPPPNRRPPPKAEFAGCEGQDLKGSSGNIQKFRGTVDISKISREDNPNITSGVNLVVDKNQGWSKVTKKGARETGLVSKELLKLAKNSTHTYFADNHSNAERAGNNRFSVLENDGFEPLDTLSQSFKGPDKVNGLLLDDQIAPSIMEKDLSSNVALANTSEGVHNFNMESNNIPNNMGHKPRMEAGLEVLNLNDRDIANKKDNMAVENASSETDGFIENNKFIPSIGIGLPACPTNFIPQMSAIEVEINTHALYSRNSHTTDKALSSTTQCPLGPPALNLTLNHAQNYNTFNVGPQGNVDKFHKSPKKRS